MLNFKCIREATTGEEFLETTITGKALLTIPQLNKGTAFPEDERSLFGLRGKLPVHVETLDEQVTRTYVQFQGQQSPLQKHIYLNNLHDKNQVLFYKLVSIHLDEMLPLIYTPMIGTAVKQFSREFRNARGLYIAYPDRKYISEILDNRTNPEIDLIVVTDGEAVLGIGDQGIGGMDIPIAKLMVYTLCGGINPLKTLPIVLDVGTNNKELLADPLYLGWRNERLRGKEYDDFIELFVSTVRQKFPNLFLHWEDFGRDTAPQILQRYRDQLCTFNDDIQGTGAVTLAALLAAIKITGIPLTEQRIIIYGAGTAGTGIANHICDAIVRAGISMDKARHNFWLMDRQGLIHSAIHDLTPSQKPYARNSHEIIKWHKNAEGKIDLLETIKHVKPTLLIGCSTQSGAFTQQIVQEMAKHTARPIIFPLSNPTDNAEATPAQLLEWTDGNALVATGSPFADVIVKGKAMRIAQCNNALVFPGIGLGVLATQALRLTDNMIAAASQALSEFTLLYADQFSLLPSLNQAREAAREIALAVGNQAMQDGVCGIDLITNLEERLDRLIWHPHYVPLRKMGSSLGHSYEI